MPTAPKSAFLFEGFEQANTTPVPDVCWIGGEILFHWKKEKATGLCFRCHDELLSKVVRQKKRARVNGCEATLTTAQWAAKLRSSQACCYYCHKRIGYRALTLEHIVPVANGGGTTDENCVPACMDCNLSQWVERRVSS